MYWNCTKKASPKLRRLITGEKNPTTTGYPLHADLTNIWSPKELEIRLVTHLFHFPVPVDNWRAHPGFRRKIVVVLSFLSKENSPWSDALTDKVSVRSIFSVNFKSWHFKHDLHCRSSDASSVAILSITWLKLSPFHEFFSLSLPSPSLSFSLSLSLSLSGYSYVLMRLFSTDFRKYFKCATLPRNASRILRPPHSPRTHIHTHTHTHTKTTTANWGLILLLLLSLLLLMWWPN